MIFLNSGICFLKFKITSKKSKIKISRDSGGVRRSVVDTFYIMGYTLDFRTNHNFEKTQNKSEENNIVLGECTK